MQTPSGHCRCKKTQTPSRHEPKTAQTASQKTVSRYLWNPHKTIFGATEHMPSLCKHHLEPHKTTLEPQSTCPAYANRPNRNHLDTADAKRPKHHLDTSRKPPKPQAKKLFHVTFGIHIKQSLEPQSTCPAYANTSLCKPSGHCRCKKTQTPSRHEPKTAQTASQKNNLSLWTCHIKQSLEPQSTCPAYANTIWNHIKQLWSHRAHAQPMQTPSGHCRCKKTQTPSRHEPKTAQTASQKTVSRYLWNPHKTIFGATEHMPSLCKHHLDTADAKRPKHQKALWSHSSHAPSLASRKPPKPQAKKLFHVTFGIHIKQSLEPQSTCPAYANTIWTLQMQKDPNTI